MSCHIIIINLIELQFHSFLFLFSELKRQFKFSRAMENVPNTHWQQSKWDSNIK